MSSAPAASYTAYLSERQSLIREERSLRRDQQSQIRHISAAEVEADKIVRRIREEEARVLWGSDATTAVATRGDGGPSGDSLFPGMGFLTAKEIILQSRIFRIIEKMPKGALLHAHLDAIVDHRRLLEFALTVGAPHMHVRVEKALNHSNLHFLAPEFRAFPIGPLLDESTSSTAGLSVTEESGYVPMSWVPLQEARRNFRLGGFGDGESASDKRFVKHKRAEGEELFDAWVLAALQIHPSEAYETMNTVDKIWDKFRSCFRTTFGLFLYEPVYREYLREVFEGCIKDGISYVELRMNFYPRTMVRAGGIDDFSHREWILAFREILKQFKEDLKKKGREGEFAGARVIYTTFRKIGVEDMEWSLEDCLQLKKEFPEEIAGFDLVGQEDQGEPLLFYAEQLIRFQERVAEEGLYLPFIFHAGETLGDGNSTDTNVIDAILLGTKRIGHGFSIAKHPLLMKMCRERDILIEVCPVSNEILRLTSSMPMHPLPAMLNSGVPVALCSDDPAIFGNLGISFDFYQVLVASEISGLTTLGTMAMDSILFSELPKDRKDQALKEWEKRWAAFIEEIVKGSN